MRFERVIKVPQWEEAERQKTISFWKQRHMTFTETSGDTLRGKRGSLWGNLLSFDMGKLCTTLTIAKTSENEVRCVLDANTMFQTITEWNEAFWRYELETFESYLLRNDLQEAAWKLFEEARKKADKSFLISAGLHAAGRAGL